MFVGNIYVDLLSIFIALACVFLAYMKWRLSFWQRKGIYTQPPSLIFGNAKGIVFQSNSQGEDFQKCYQDFKRRGLRFGGYYAFAKPIFIPTDLDLIKSIMVKDFNYFMDHGVHCDSEADPLTAHLFALPGQEWRLMRVKLTPTFTTGKMKMMFNILLKCAQDLKEHMDELISNKLPVDIKDVAGKFTTDIIMTTAFGLEGNCLKNPETDYRKYGMKFFANGPKDVFLRLMSFQWPEFLYFFKMSSIRQDVSKFFQKIARETVEYREKNNIIRKDFMHLLIQLKNNVKINDNDLGNITGGHSDESITMEQLMAQAFVFFIAGFETSSSTATFCMYELVRNPQYQDRLRNEINQVLDQFNGEITYEALQRMTYMDQCFNEALRLYPIVTFHGRECTQDYKIPNTDIVIPKGCSVAIPVLGIQRDPDYYPDPLKYDPDRFLPENTAKRHPFTWTPFGEGPRVCIGQRFGVMQTKLALAILIKNYRFTLNPKTKTPIEFEPGSFILTTKGDLLLNAEKIV